MHPVKFAVKAITEFAKDSSVSVFELDSMDDFSYLIDDLKPEVILVHKESVEAGSVMFFGELEKAEFRGFKTAIMTEQEPDSFCDQFDFVVDLPVDPSALIEQLSRSIA